MEWKVLLYVYNWLVVEFGMFIMILLSRASLVYFGVYIICFGLVVFFIFVNVVYDV